MVKVIEFLRKDRLYILLLIFIILLNVLMVSVKEEKGKEKAGVSQGAAVTKIEKKTRALDEKLFVTPEEAEKILREKKPLAIILSLSSLLILAVLILGLTINIVLLSVKLSGKDIDIHTYRSEGINWNMWDVSKVVILFLFFGYMVIIIESIVARYFPLLKNDNFRMILNTSILDILTIVFILYFTVVQYKEKLVSLGISVKNFLKNVFYGIVGYVAAAPILAAILILVISVANLVKYVPEKQLIVDLFLKEKDVKFLIYTSLFASIVGPIIEELFFRGFMYNALKKYIGIFWSMLFTAAIFATLHANIVGFLPIMALGVLLAYLYEKTGTLISSITVHMAHNMSMVFLVFLLKELKALGI